jgi:ketosteroid isomerase-like protein
MEHAPLEQTGARNVELARRALEAANASPPDYATMNALFHRDHEFVSRVDALERGIHRGARGYRAWLRDAGEAVEWEGRLEEVRAIDADHVLAIMPGRVRGMSSGVVLNDERWGVVMTLRDGRVTCTEVYASAERALDAARLPDRATSANLELVRSLYSRWQRGDVSSSDWVHPQIEVVFADGPNPGTWRGLSGLTAGWREVLNAWEHFHPEVERYEELDDARILVLVRWHGRGKRSGVQVAETGALGAQLLHIAAGRVDRLVTYLERERAFADLGINV